MYQSYPETGQPPEPQRPPAPSSVQTAVKLMYAGAALSLIELIVGLITIGSVRSAIRKAFPNYTSSQLHAAEVTSVVVGVVVGLIAIGLWVWMARANAAGHNYARITGTVFFGLNTLFLLLSLARPHASIGLIFNILVWLAGLGAVIMLWRKESGPYFKPAGQ
jgi:ABC-type glucose/galactose transport system permease subunit